MRTTANLRQRNEQQIHAHILLKGPKSRKKLVDLTHLTGAAVSRITRDMITDGILVEGEGTVAEGRLGRREVELEANPTFRYVIGITITGDRRSLALADATGRVVQEKDISKIDISDPVGALASIAEAAMHLIYEAGLKKADIAGVGVSMAILASDSDEIVTAPPINWENIPVRRILADHLGLQVKVEARATSILRVEILRQSPALDSMFLINVAHGVGSSAFLNSQLVQPGTAGFGGVSHFAIQGEKALCTCGRQGCIEVCAGGRRVLEDLKLEHSDIEARNKNIKACIAAANAGEKNAVKALRDAGARLAFGVDAAMSLFEPSKIVISGEIGRQKQYVTGVVEQLKILGRYIGEGRIEQSSIKSHEAATWLALQAFLAPGLIDVAATRKEIQT